jgi:WD40 repeat protein/DNA-binding XRE family transcriptional regulator
MTKTSYREQDHDFGQQMLDLRMATGLTQAGLGNILNVSRHTVGAWEAGESYPKANHLKAFITLIFEQQGFQAGSEEEQIRALWRSAHQKVLLDELWLKSLLDQQVVPLVSTLVRQVHHQNVITPSPIESGPKVDWGDALDIPTFYGREEEQALLSRWILQDHCRVISVLGIGGIGKSALTTRVMHQVASQFEAVIWRSLRDAPSCEEIVKDCLQILAPQILSEAPTSFERNLHLLMQQLRAQRVLLVLDNVETILEEGTGTGRMRAGFDGYASLLRQGGETAHQSCLLLTSREKPVDLIHLEGRSSPVRTVRLAGLDAAAGAALLEEKYIVSSSDEQAQLVEVYQGNPLALQIVAHTIVELFGGEIIPFLQQGETVFGGIRQLLDEQFMRLSALEQTVLLWLTILREPVSLHTLLAILNTPMPTAQVLEAVEGLRRRSLIEQGHRAGSFTLQSVVLEYATAWLIEEGSREIEQGQLALLLEHGLCLAPVKEYVRQTQEQLLVIPLLTRLQNTSQAQSEVEERLLRLLDAMRNRDQATQGYGPANLVTLLRELRGHLRRLDLSRLALRGLFLQGIDLQDSTLSHALLQESIFTEPLDAILAVAMSKTGAYWAAAGGRGEIRLWDGNGQTLHHIWRAHTEMVWTLALSPDERTLASASSTGSIKLWEVNSGILLWESWPRESFVWLAFSPIGDVLASGGVDGLVHLRDAQHGTPLKELQHTSGVFWLAWSPNGRQLAIGCFDGSIWLWEMPQPEMPVQVLAAHKHRVTGLAFSLDGTQLASASYDGTIKLWDLITGNCLQTFTGPTDRVLRVAWSPDGRTLASCGYDAIIQFWDIQTGKTSKVLQGHSSVVTSLVFTPDSRTLVSGSYDGTLRVWDVESGKLLRTIGGHTDSLLDLDWSPDGTQLASYGTDMQVVLWGVNSGVPQSVGQEHRDMVQGQGVAWSPDGHLLASGGRDFIILWDSLTSTCIDELRDPDAIDTVFQGVAWSPDGRLLAVGSYLHGVQVWDMTTRIRRWMAHTQATRIRRVAWSPDGSLLVGGGYDDSVYVWDASDGIQQQRLVGHEGIVMSVAWSPDGRWLASGGGGKEGGQLFVWKMQGGERVQILAGHSDVVSSVVWSPGGKLLISGDSDGKLRWWEVESGQCLRVREGHQGMVQALKVSPDGSTLASCGDDGAIRLWNLDNGEYLRTLQRDRPYERLNITGIRGLSHAQKASLHALGAFEEISTWR